MAFQFPAAPVIGQLFSPSTGITYQWVGYAWVPISVNPTSPISYGQRNRIINPSLRFDQVKEGAAYSVSAASIQAMDAWSGNAVGPGAFSVTRELSGLAAGNYDILAAVTTPDAAPGATAQYIIYSTIEGLNIADLYSGFVTSKYVIASFNVQSSIAGTFAGAFINNGGTRSFPFQFTIITPGVVQRVNVALKLDETGTWLADTGVGISLVLTLGAGTNFNGTPNVWQAGNKQSVAGSTNLMATGGATLRFGDFDFYSSQVARNYEAPEVGMDLAYVQRYASKSYSNGVSLGTVTLAGECVVGTFTAINSNTNCWIPFKASMRIPPSMLGYSASTGVVGKWIDATGADQNIAFLGVGTDSCFARMITGDLSAIAGHFYSQCRLS